MFAFGRTADNGGYLTATPGAGTTPHQASIAGPGASPVAQTAAAPVALAANTWKHVAVTVKGGDAATPGQLLLYEDGVLVALERRADGQAALTSPRRSASSAARAPRPGSSSGAGSRTSASTRRS